MTKTYIGIDPGSAGFVSAIFPDGSLEFCPIADCTEQELYKFLLRVKQRSAQVTAVMEDVHAIFGSSAKGTFSFGEIKGLLKGLLIASEIPYTLVPPKEWQGEMWTTADIVASTKTVKDGRGEEKKRRVIDTKATSLNCARRLFPTVDFRKTEKCKKPDDNKADALLMAEYARRKNL